MALPAFDTPPTLLAKENCASKRVNNYTCFHLQSFPHFTNRPTLHVIHRVLVIPHPLVAHRIAGIRTVTGNNWLRRRRTGIFGREGGGDGRTQTATTTTSPTTATSPTIHHPSLAVPEPPLTSPTTQPQPQPRRQNNHNYKRKQTTKCDNDTIIVNVL